MKKLLVATLLVAFAATAALAADTIVLEAKNGNVIFNHKAHADKLGCEACHQGGPTKCGVCHKK